MSRLRERLRAGEGGFALPELLVSIIIGVVVIGTLVMVVTIADRGTARVTARVDANQQARPVVQRIMDELHSSCVARNVAPIIAGSTDTQIEFIQQTGSQAVLTPVKRQIFLSGTSLIERTYVATAGSGPTWTFSSTPATSPPELRERVLATNVARPSTSTSPIFSYYKYVNGAVSPTRQTTPLSASEAAQTVQVTVSFKSLPANNGAKDPNADVVVSDTALLRFAPAGESTSDVNLPCQ